MQRRPICIDADITRANTMPSFFYKDPYYYELLREHLFAKSWQFIGDTDRVKEPGQAYPWTILQDYLNEPVLLTRDAGGVLNCFSNVCTHRGNLLVEEPCRSQLLRCRYHGRCFALDGSFHSTPGFEEAQEFPSAADHLSKVAFGTWGKWVFASLNPILDLEEIIGDMRRRLDWLPLEEFELDPSGCRDYEIEANWALYCDNYLEGFHIPYVHPFLASQLDIKNYPVESYNYSFLQIGIAKNEEIAFKLPRSSPDYGKTVAAYYYWLFPNMMLNFYPWGLSLNVVNPVTPDRTRICYFSYVCDKSKLGIGAGADVNQTEKEDDAIVQRAHQGMKSRLYHTGRYSPQWEPGVHLFHRLLASFIATAEDNGLIERELCSTAT